MRMVIVFFLILISIQGVGQESISYGTVVIIRTFKHAIYVGADSRAYRGNFSGDKQIGATKSSMCKIWTNGKVGVAAQGVRVEENMINAIKFCKRGGRIEDIMFLIGEQLSKDAKDVLQDTRKNYPNEFQQILSFGSAISRIFIWGIDKDSLYHREILIRLISGASPTVEIRPEYHAKANYAAGSIRGIEKLINDNGAWTNESSIPAQMKYLINMAATDNREFVGGNVDVLKFTKSKVEWFQAKPECQ